MFSIVVKRFSVVFQFSPRKFIASTYSAPFSRVESHFHLPTIFNALTSSQPEMKYSNGRASVNSNCHSMLPASRIFTLLPPPSCTNILTVNILE